MTTRTTSIPANIAKRLAEMPDGTSIDYMCMTDDDICIAMDICRMTLYRMRQRGTFPQPDIRDGRVIRTSFRTYRRAMHRAE